MNNLKLIKMQRECLCVKFIEVKNCFAYLPEKYLQKLRSEDNVIEILHGQKSLFVYCNSKPCNNECLGLNANFAQNLGINEDDLVFVSCIRGSPSVKRAYVTPHRADDHRILELQFTKIQSNLMNQLRIIAKGQPFLIWISKHSYITLTTESLEPNFTFGKLEEFTEIFINQAREETIPEETEQDIINNRTYLGSLFSNFQEFFTTNVNRTEDISKLNRMKILENSKASDGSVILRVCSLPSLNEVNVSSDNMFNILLQSSYNVLVARVNLKNRINLQYGCTYCKMQKVLPAKSMSSDENNQINLANELTVKVLALEDYLEKFDTHTTKFCSLSSNYPNVYVSDAIKVTLNLKDSSKIILKSMNFLEENEKVTTLKIFPYDGVFNLESFNQHIKKLEKYGKVLINSNAMFNVFNNNAERTMVYVQIFPTNITYISLDETLFENIQITENKLADSTQLLNKHIKENKKDADVFKLKNQEYVTSECITTLKLSLNLHNCVQLNYDRENVLICGIVGSGKTTICKLIEKYMQNMPYFAHTCWIDGKRLQGKKAEMIQKFLNPILSECTYYQPSIIFIDDIECISNIPDGSNDENSPEVINADRIAEVFINTIQEYQKLHYISVIATCSNITKIGQKLKPRRGCHFFKTVLTISNFEKNDRITILKYLLKDKIDMTEWMGFDTLGAKTEGWTIQDLLDFTNKLQFIIFKSDNKDYKLSTKDITEILEKTIPCSMHGLNLYKGSKYTWSNIGGLTNVKKTLIEILHWPLKYPNIFTNAPIKLQNGVLLYGMPGTGKTILAKAIANECGVNLINIKGPELLSKYIGVSEESVREVFERAQNAKPCVLFFDEFESFAPRRGHDNTGVTDRVVNQLLTQLDGVEDREGVAVIAATSRPDLLDPALLRPGRLDKHLQCPIPNEEERREILAALLKTENSDDMGLDLVEIARMTSGFTGADLNAVITQAKLLAFDKLMEKPTDDQENEIEETDLKITQKDLIKAAKSTHPSLSSKEKLKYDEVYSRFTKGEGNTVEDYRKKQKSTFA